MTDARPGVLLIGNHAPPFGGVPNHVGALSRHLAAEGWRVHVLADVSARGGQFEIDGYTVHAPTQAAKIRVLLTTIRGAGRGRVVGAMLRKWPHAWGDVARAAQIRHIVVRHDLQLLSAYHVLKPGLSAAWVSEDLGLPLVTTVFGEFYARPEEHRSRLDHVDYIMRTSALRLSCSRHCADSVAWLGVDIPVDVLYYGVDVDRFRPAATAGSGDAVVVAYVGRMVEEMGLGTLLTALPDLLRDPRIRVVIAGARGHLTAAAEEAAARHPGRVAVRADVPAAELPDIYRQADVVVAPSVNDRACLGLAIAEGMASGVPVIGCRVGGTPEVIEDGVTGRLVPPHDASALVDAIMGYATDPVIRRVHGAQARLRAVAKFDIGITNRRCQEMFSALLGSATND